MRLKWSMSIHHERNGRWKRTLRSPLLLEHPLEFPAVEQARELVAQRPAARSWASVSSSFNA